MEAIVQIGGRQYRVKPNQKVVVDRLSAAENEEVVFEQVKALLDEGSLKVGASAVESAQVVGKVLRHFKGGKVVVFKKKRRKGYRVKRGHRQPLSQVEIVSIHA